MKKSYLKIFFGVSFLIIGIFFFFSYKINVDAFFHNGEEYTLTIEIEEEGRGMVQSVVSHEREEKITITATPKKGYYFSRWERNGNVLSREENYTFVLEESMRVVAVFNEEVDVTDKSFLPKKESDLKKAEEARERVALFRENIGILLKNTSDQNIRIKLIEVLEKIENIDKKIRKEKEEIKIVIERFKKIREESVVILSQKERAKGIIDFAVGLLFIAEEEKEIEELLIDIIKGAEEIKKKLKDKLNQH